MITLFSIRPKGFNVGNDAIFMGLQYFINQSFGEIVNIISLPATSRYETHQSSGLRARTVHEINQYGDGVIIGGGNLYENGELDVDLTALEALEVPCMLFSISSGRIYNRKGELVNRTDAMPKHVIQALHRKIKYSLARDHSTCGYLHDLGCDNAEVGGCPTIFLDRLANRLPTISSRDQGCVLISVRNPSLMNIPLTKQAEVYKDVNALIEFVRSQGYQDVRLLCHDHRDIAFAASFSNIDYVYTGDVYTYLTLLKNCALNITYRLHSFLPCLSFGTPTIKISYDERAISLINTVGYNDWNINIMKTTDVIGQVIDRYNRLEQLKKLRDCTQPIWNDLHAKMLGTFEQFASDVIAYKKSTLK